MSVRIDRRRFLRGSLGGAAVSVWLPLLELFLNDHGDALAATGAPLPLRFGTWFFGCGMNPPRWNPKTAGPDWEMTPELLPLASVRERINVLSGFSVLGRGRFDASAHRRGVISTLTGGYAKAPTVDVLISDQIGGSTRFRSLEMAATGLPTHSYSYRTPDSLNASEPTPLSLYTRVFGPGFVDPNRAEFTPEPRLLLRRSAISMVADERARLERGLGAADRARLDQYFTALRQLEHQIELQLQRPPPLRACEVPAPPAAAARTTEIQTVVENHALMARTLALALACDQTRVFNMVFSNGASVLRIRGRADNHHGLTHQRPERPDLGYRHRAGAFVLESMRAFATFVEALDAVPEGDGTLLDRCLVMAHSETSDANAHSLEGLPFLLAGRAGGRVRTGLHVNGVGASASRVGLTMQRVMGLQVDRWGRVPNEVTESIEEILA